VKQIALVGIDGTGKTTLTQSLCTALTQTGQSALGLRIKSHNDILFSHIEAIYDYSVSMETRFAGSMLDLLHIYFKYTEEEKQDYLIWDRFSYCLINYAKILRIQNAEVEKILGILKRPDYVFLLDMDATLAQERIKKRGKPLRETDQIAFQQHLREYYHAQAQEEGFIILDAIEKTEVLTEQILSILSEKYTKIDWPSIRI
jgi:thymidylate kinase